jgi:hypothetical protein
MRDATIVKSYQTIAKESKSDDLEALMGSKIAA